METIVDIYFKLRLVTLNIKFIGIIRRMNLKFTNEIEIGRMKSNQTNEFESDEWNWIRWMKSNQTNEIESDAFPDANP